MKIQINNIYGYARLSSDDIPPKEELIKETPDINKCFFVYRNFYQNKFLKYIFSSFSTWEEHFKNINKLSVGVKNKRSYIYEMIREGLTVKPHLDIEHVYNNFDEYQMNRVIFLNKCISDILDIFKKEYEYEITRDDIYICENSRSTDNGFKMSFHFVISPKKINLLFKTNVKYGGSSAYHFFSLLLSRDPLYYSLFLDKSIYTRDRLMRCIGSYKDINDEEPMTFIYSTTYEKETKITKDIYLNCLITYQNPKNETIYLITPMIEQTETNNKPSILKEIKTNDHIKNELIKRIGDGISNSLYYIDEHNKYVCDDFDGCKMKYIGFYDGYTTLTHDKEKCPLSCAEHSKKDKLYITYSNDGYILKCFSDKCDKYFVNLGHVQDDEAYKNNCHKIDTKYNIMDNITPLCQGYDIRNYIHSKDNDARQYINKWLNDSSLKSLALKANMGTGKTECIKLIIETRQFSRVLWVTSRITLTENIIGKFKKYNFVSYLDIDGSMFNHDKIICQVDSLDRIMTNDKTKLKAYDLIIIDESESVMNHFASPHLEKKQKTARSTFDILEQVSRTAKKILCLDADYNIRSFKFIEHFGRSLLIHNIRTTTKKKFIMTNDKKKFNKQIADDLNNGLKICIASMSASDILMIKNDLDQLNTNIKYKMYYGKTSDTDKSELQQVNEIWENYDLIMFSPTIESGVDVTIRFNKMYGVCYGGPMTTSQRAFVQMCGRLRNVEDNNILCYCDSAINMNISGDLYTFDEILNAFKYIENLMNKPILKYVYSDPDEDGISTRKYDKNKISLFDDISILNYSEIINKNVNVWLSVFYKNIREKGHDMIILKDSDDTEHNENTDSDDDHDDDHEDHSDTQKDDKDEKDNITITNTTKAREIIINKFCEIKTTSAYDREIYQKQKNGDKLTEEEKIIIERYLLNKKFNIQFDEIELKNIGETATNENTGLCEYIGFLNEFYHKKEGAYNNIENEFYKEYINKNTIFDNFTTLTNIKNDLVKRLMDGRELLIDTSIDINFNELEAVKQDIITNSLFFKEEAKINIMMKRQKTRRTHSIATSNKTFIFAIQQFLEHWGILFRQNNNRKITINKKRVCIFELNYDNSIIDILNVKYKKKDISDKYPNIIFNNNNECLLSDDEI